MAKKAFNKIAEGLNEALAIARGEVQPAWPYIPRLPDVIERDPALALQLLRFVNAKKAGLLGH